MSTARHIAFVCPRFAETGTVGGAETLLKNFAVRAAAAGRRVTFLTTCAADHFTWENEIPPGVRRYNENMEVHFFPVDERRDLDAFVRAQDLISRGAPYTPEDEQVWLANSVNSAALCEHLAEAGADYDRIIIGPYLFGISWFACRVRPRQTILLPCLHDEHYARVRAFRDMFRDVGGLIFNSAPEQALAMRLYDLPPERARVVGMGLDPFEADATAFSRRHGLQVPYVLYSGRREAGKGVPLLLDYVNLFRQRTAIDVKIVFTGAGRLEPPAALIPHLLDAGFVSEQEKREAMAGAAVFCQPSTNESFSIVLLEAWLAGTPALVHARCDVTVNHCRQSGGGFWFMTYAEFEEELLTLLRHPELRGRMGNAGRDYVRREYAWSAVLDKFLNAVDTLT